MSGYYNKGLTKVFVLLAQHHLVIKQGICVSQFLSLGRSWCTITQTAINRDTTAGKSQCVHGSLAITDQG